MYLCISQLRSVQKYWCNNINIKYISETKLWSTLVVKWKRFADLSDHGSFSSPHSDFFEFLYNFSALFSHHRFVRGENVGEQMFSVGMSTETDYD